MFCRLVPVLALLCLLSSVSAAYSASSEMRQAWIFPPPPVRAFGAVVMNASTGQVLMSVDAHRRLPMASTTKIMTALLAVELGGLSDRIVVPAGAFNFESDASVMGLRAGDVVTLRELLYGLLLPSGADAANVIAIHYAGSESRFVILMNREARRLGMYDTHYATPHGLPAPNQYSSAYDLAVLGRYVSAIPALMHIVCTRSYSWNGHVFTNLNHVIFWYPGADGIKPGFTNEAGLCQVLDIRRDGRHLVVALLHTSDMVIDARNLIDYGLQDFRWVGSSLGDDGPDLEQRGVDRFGQFVYFPGSGHYVRGQFLQAFIAHGGLRALGFPRTEQIFVGPRLTQYFQNGMLAMTSTGQIIRLPLGLTLLPIPKLPPPVPPGVEQTSGERMDITHATAVTPQVMFRRRQAWPPVPPVPDAPSVTPVSHVAAKVFRRFYRSHHGLLGTPVTEEQWAHGFLTQIFTFGALTYSGRTHTVMLLPLGDRWLARRNFLPAHPGTVYPRGYASRSVIRAIGWL